MITVDASNMASSMFTNFQIYVNFKIAYTKIFPIVMAAYSVIIFYTIGFLAIVVPVLTVVIILLQKFISQRMKTFNRQRLKYADKRGKKIKEIINGISMIKFNGWEKIMIE